MSRNYMSFSKRIKLATQSTLLPAAVLIWSIGIQGEAYGQEEISGKAVFAHYGIDDDLPKLGVSSLMQGEHLVEHIQRQLTIGEKVSRSNVYLVKNTDENGNIDLRLKYDKNQLDENEDAISQIENSTRLQYRMRNWAQSYDPNSVAAVDHGNGLVEISFDYSKYGLPQDIAYFRFLKVKVEVIAGKPQKMTITNRKSFKLDGYTVERYQQDIAFNHLDSGKLIIEKKYVEITGTKGKKPVSLIETIKPVALYNDASGVDILDQTRLTEVSDPRFIEEEVKVNRTFPLMGDMVRQQGIDLPLPFGVSVAYRNQDMNIPTNDFVIGGIRLNELFDPSDTLANVSAESLTLRGDVNILPFWNMFGFVGKINVDANIDAGYTGKAGEEIQDKLDNLKPGLGDAFCDGLSTVCEPGRLNVPLHLEYDLIGLGTTLSVGYKAFFASVTGTYSTTRLEGSDNWGDAIVTVQPMLGYQLVDYRAQLIVGAEYQGLKNRMQGRVITDDIEFDYDVGVDLENWAYLAGFNKQIGKNYNLTFLYNKGETREALTLNLGYRF